MCLAPCIPRQLNTQLSISTLGAPTRYQCKNTVQVLHLLNHQLHALSRRFDDATAPSPCLQVKDVARWFSRNTVGVARVDLRRPT
jgi:hypothetical protein